MSYNSFGGSTFQTFPECYNKIGKQAGTYKQSIFRFATGEIQGFVNNTARVNTIDIPENIWGVPVTSIAAGAFSGNRLSNVTIPNSVRSIGRDAFSCTNCQYDFRGSTDYNNDRAPRGRDFREGNNPYISITIGANVTMDGDPFRFSEYDSKYIADCGQYGCWKTVLVINEKFRENYDENGRGAGTYYYFHPRWRYVSLIVAREAYGDQTYQTKDRSLIIAKKAEEEHQTKVGWYLGAMLVAGLALLVFCFAAGAQ